jgi:hypothetical protein
MIDTAITGPKSKFRGKLRGSRTMSITFTPAGHEALARGQERMNMSRPDYLEYLVRKDDAAHRNTAVSS